MTNSRASLPPPKGARASSQQKAAADAQRIAGKLSAAVALHQQGRLAQAQLLYTEILQAQPRHFDALQLLATIAVQQKNPDAALVLFEHALKINPDNAAVLSNQASALLALKRYEESLQSCDRALKNRPDYAEAWSNRGNALWAMNRAADALASYDRALAIKPDYPEALSSRGAALRTLGRPLEALQSYDRALRLRPAYADALNNQGAALQDLQHPAEALDSYARAQQVQPVYADAHWNEALCRLMLGEFELGWQKYEWRWKKEPGLSMARNFSQPLWLGKEPLQGKTILLHAEQGLGDTIQFCRYAKEVAALGARVVLEVQPALKALLQGLEGASLVIGKGEGLPDFDYHCPLLSLPLAFQADLSNISGQSYLHSDPAKRQHWQGRLGAAGQTRIGLVWSGATGHQNDHNRSLSLEQIRPLLSEQAQYYCLQKELRPADRATLAHTPALQFLGDSLKDFSDTAALLEQMELLITVDTSVAHLAGALGKEVWILLPFSPDWRWLLERSDNPWYASARLFRQPAPGDWASVLAQVQAALKLRLAGGPRQTATPSRTESAPVPAPVPKPAAMTAQAVAAQLARAVSLHQQGQLDQAQVLYQEILQVQPQHFDALQLSATIAMQQKRSAAAVVLFDQALKIQPLHAAALNNRGNALRDLGRAAEALESYDKALTLQPDYVEALSNRGAALRQLGRLADALQSYERALALKPDYALALSNRGNTLRALGRPLEALQSHDRALQIQPDSPETLISRAGALLDLKRPEEALASCTRVLQLRPNHPEALNSSGNALWALRQSAQALDSFDRALAARPDYAEALSNRGNVRRELQRPAEALADFASALQHKADYPDAHWNEALCRLMLGEFELGWQKYEWRWKKEPGLSMARNFSQPLWLGKEPLQGKTILLHAEQGLGDTIQFCRYAKEVAALGARVVLEVQPALKALLQGLEGASLVIGKGEGLPDFDYHCPLLSLPLAFQADLSNISGQSYLHSDPAKRQHWQGRLGAAGQTRIGLVWSGATGHQNDHNRSLSLEQIRPLLSEQAQYYCLQKELRPADRATLAHTPALQFLGDSLKDFSDTAALLEQMELLITVDTSVAHLAGALGKEVWILLPFSPDWRWLLERSDNPWYASARLFRQPAPGDWASVLAQVQAALKLRLAGGPRQTATPSRTESAPVPAPVPKPAAMTAQAVAAQLARAVSLHQQGQLDQAQVLYQEILQVQPQHFDALQLLAMVEAQKNNAAAALVLFEQALALNPQHAGALNNCGNVLRALKRPGEALESYDRALAVQPDYAEALGNRGNALQDLKRHGDALQAYERALAIQPGNVDALIGRGSALGALERHVQALESFDEALRLQPDSAQVLSNRGLALQNLKRYAEALENCERALRIKPDFVEGWSHRGNALRALHRPLEALESFDRALGIHPAYAEALGNRGLALQDLNRLSEARDSYARALQLEPDRADAIWNESLCALVMGDFATGWPKYESRWRRAPGSHLARNFSQPLWLGKEPLQGKTILLHAEQGLGDTIQFCRYAKEVAALGARVVLEVQPALKALLQGLEGASLVIGKGEGLPDFDHHCPLLSLPLAFQADLSNISGQSYLHSDPAKRQHWQGRLGAAGQTRIGLVWSGATGHQNDHNRSLSLEQIRPLLSEQAQYYCLQKELRPADRATLAHTPALQFLGDSLKDFSDTAALLEQMELLITVDTSVAHLAGALGKEVWILLPFSPDWRWLLERSDNPWYASARLFRQPAPGDWASVLAQVQAALKLRLAGGPRWPEPAPAPTPKPAVLSAQALDDRLKQAVNLHQQGQLDQAQLLYQEILQVQPQHFDALQLLAMVEAQKNNAAAALVLFEQALALNPQHAGALNNCGNVLRALKRQGEALASYDAALQIHPDFAEALRNRGDILRDLKRPAEALASYERALHIEPGHADALGNRGGALRDLGRAAEALASYELALRIDPDSAEALSNRGAVLRDLKRPGQALESCERALVIRPDFAEALCNRGAAQQDLNQPVQALESYDRALQLKPAYPQAWSNRGVTLRALLRPTEALESFARALQLVPDYPEAHANEALCRLMLGEFELGWQKYEWRWKKEPGLSMARNFSQPLWLGKEPLQGKTILLHAEQGLGDTIQFCRYAKEVAALGARVVLEVQPALKALLQGLEGASLVIGKGEGLPDFDYHCPLLSLPLAFQADLSNISGQSYLHSDPAKRQHWQGRLGAAGQTRIGLVWSGATGHQNDHNRSLSLEQIRPLLSEQAQYYCLQKELRPADRATLAHTPALQFLGDSLKDFSDTAALLEQMELLITVDTSVAHLAGALGKEVWILLPFSPDWRWLLERSDNPWYASARLFRQPAPGDWASVLAQVQAALKEKLQ